MYKLIFSVAVFLVFIVCPVFADITWVDDLESAKHSSKVFKKPILLWVGVHSFRTRPMILTEKPFLELSKKIICVNLNPKEMTDEQKEAYGVDNSNFSKFYYYDIDFNLLGTENNPPNAVIANIHAMLKSIEAKEEGVKVEKEEQVTEDGAKVLWEKANRFEVDEKYDSMLTMLKQIVAKFPTSSYADLAKLKIEKIENDPTLKLLLENQRKEDNASRILKSVDILIKNNKKADAIKKLNSLVTDFPGTKAAKEAGELLDKLRKE